VTKSTAVLFAQALCLAVGVASAQVGQPPYPPTYPSPYPQPNPAPYPVTEQSMPSGDMTAKTPLLLALVLQPLMGQTGASLSSGIGALFGRLFRWISGDSGAAGTTQPNQVAGIYPGNPNPAYAAGLPYGAGVRPNNMPPIYQNPAQTGSPVYGTTPGQAQPTYPYQPPSQNPAPPIYGSPATQAQPAYPNPPTYQNPTQSGAAPVYGAPPVVTPGTPYPGAATPPAYGTPSVSGGSPVAPQLPPTFGAKLVPSVIYTVEQLDSHTFATTAQLDLSHGTPTLYTGDVFAIKYSTNVSGQVRIDNIDGQGQKSALGTYNVVSGHDNRIPLKKGIQLVGGAGLETFKMYFFPCNPSGTWTASADPQSSMPACPTSPSEKLAAASKGLVMPKAAVNLDSPDPTIAVSAVTDYQPQDVTENDFQIRHSVRDPP
jgi:hypothetical protein